MHVAFRRYKYSIFTLQKAALKIQHWFFKKKEYASRISLRARPSMAECDDNTKSVCNYSMSAGNRSSNFRTQPGKKTPNKVAKTFKTNTSNLGKKRKEEPTSK